MKNGVLLVMLAVMLTGCSWLQTHKIDIDQGNIIQEQDVKRLHHGMSEAQVKSIMGNPVLVNVFTPGRLDYVYTFQAGHGQLTQTRVICLFEHGRLIDIKRN